jgi:hypothetical protein
MARTCNHCCGATFLTRYAAIPEPHGLNAAQERLPEDALDYSHSHLSESAPSSLFLIPQACQRITLRQALEQRGQLQAGPPRQHLC